MTTKFEDVAHQSFDYVIAGGGTAGLTLATPQEYADGIEMQWPRGKGLGGSSSINFFGFGKPPAEDINDFERLGNPGWNWEHLNSAMHKLEGFVRPSEEMLARTQSRVGLWQLGTEGPLKITFPPVINAVDGITLFNLGIPPAPNPASSSCKGAYLGPNTHDPRTYTRSYATTAFYLPNKDRPNLHVLTFAHVVRVVTEPTASGDLVATGVEFLHDGKTYVANANKEVILSAGALKSPQILELSGIGDPKVLDKINVPVKVNLPGVGSNVQDHALIPVGYELKDNAAFETFDLLSDPAVAEEHLQLHNTLQGLHTQGVVGYAFCSLDMVTDKAEKMYIATKETITKRLPSCSPGLQDQYKVELDRLRFGRPVVEILTFPGNISKPNPPTPGKKHISLHAGNHHCLSRGTIHCTTNDPLQDPEFDPHYFEEDIGTLIRNCGPYIMSEKRKKPDLQILVEAVHFIRKAVATSPLKEIVAREVNPGPLAEPGNEEQMRTWIRRNFYSPWHTSSSCSMLPREKGGVVDPSLKVYGTTNLRVVDLSIIPIHIAAHTQAIVYGIAARAADIITEAA
ncbi:hypothetical protein EIP91_012148 [Steccherinum ochraceum]|uniref:Glucose-methanol-choline oxidoreductase N-terminal domain-containing protein n=1 Tax=Steccherinum ochraceum TaxID=92696 RepID=A0A4R0S1L5_9APHY|nr:hypothetical protein EIP91_012148 [Steccherinum ochraceum]